MGRIFFCVQIAILVSPTELLIRHIFIISTSKTGICILPWSCKIKHYIKEIHLVNSIEARHKWKYIRHSVRRWFWNKTVVNCVYFLTGVLRLKDMNFFGKFLSCIYFSKLRLMQLRFSSCVFKCCLHTRKTDKFTNRIACTTNIKCACKSIMAGNK